MKINLFLVGFVVSTIFCSAQISTTRMNDFKIGMFPSDLFKLIGNKAAAIAIDTEFSIVNKGIEYTLYVGDGYLSGENGGAYLKSISTKSKNIKTLSGLGIGSTLDDLWNAYSTKYYVFINKEIEGIRSFSIQDEQNGTILTFELINGRVDKIEINSYNPEECTL
ncbi:hypothetical protein [Chishuiella sp.]|uniref:hypothetical protein n=1 Tax=Chishuiella sp. TaxID=1969467 RepID=UPI0028A975B1|nr:hypothetical protein [Chishuiella sp.]